MDFKVDQTVEQYRITLNKIFEVYSDELQKLKEALERIFSEEKNAGTSN